MILITIICKTVVKYLFVRLIAYFILILILIFINITFGLDWLCGFFSGLVICITVGDIVSVKLSLKNNI